MSFSPSPTKSRNSYAGTPQHLKTLDILGKSKNFAKLSINDLSLYCDLAKTKFGCENANDVASILEDKYGWDVSTRTEDIEEAWKISQITISDDESENDAPNNSQQKNKSSNPTNIQSTDIPVIIKSGAFSRPVMICEVDDDELQFTGDSGAVGRIFCEPSSLRLDLKGRQYSAQITSGPTIMILNLAAPVGQGGGASVCARAEVITNEFCHLEFEKDLHGNMQGVYTGNEGDNELFERDSDEDSGVRMSAKGKKHKGGKMSKADAILAAKDANNPKISTITQRKRKSSGKSSGSKKTPSSSKKKKT